MKYLIALVN